MITKLQVKYIQSLGQKKIRDEEGVFIAEGPKIINELLTQGPVLLQLFATEEWLLQQPEAIKATAHLVTHNELERLSHLSAPNQVLGIFKKPSWPTATNKTGFTLVLDGIQDPGNMGTIIRIADWFGIQHILCSQDCADAFAPKVVQSTMGGIVRVQINYGSLTDLLLNQPLPIFAAALNGQPLTDIKPVKQGYLVIGNESKGIRENIMQLCTHKITIPGRGGAESLNAAVAAGIIVSHLLEL
ncbi:MAG: RNA methyltransferase [Sphingobacteriales bacterium]|nr:MAG: RNA methyltransferase [Sphingobacteriales bacterium]